MYISAPLRALRNSKRVLFCTNTSHRQTQSFLDLCITILRGIPFYQQNLLSPEQLSYDCNLAIRVATTHNIIWGEIGGCQDMAKFESDEAHSSCE